MVSCICIFTLIVPLYFLLTPSPLPSLSEQAVFFNPAGDGTNSTRTRDRLGKGQGWQKKVSAAGFGLKSAAPTKANAMRMKAVTTGLDMPAQDTRLLQTDMEKFVGDDWKPRRVVLTADAICFLKICPEQIETCIDRILLDDVIILDGREFDRATGQIKNLHMAPLLPFHLTAEEHRLIQLDTIETECHCARKYLLRTPSPELRQHWAMTLETQIATCQNNSRMRNKFSHYQARSRKYFQSTVTRWVFAFFILASFMFDALEMQYLPLGRSNSQMGDMFFIFELVFTVIFTVELCWNMFTFWFWEFWSDYWSIFDVIVVLASIVSVGSQGTNVKSIRLVRVLRALRVVSQFKSLRKIVRAITQAIFPVLSAMFVAIIVIAVYAILGVNFYAEMNPEYFGDFGRAVWTLVTAATMENWVTYAVDLMGGVPGQLDPGIIAFFVSYIVIVAYVLTSVVVALLLENFTEASQTEQEIEDKYKESEDLKEHNKNRHLSP